MDQSSENETQAQWEAILINAVHDIRTPLSGILMALEMLRDLHAGQEKSAKVISLIDRQVTEISHQLERLLQEPASFLPPPSGD